MQVNIKKLKGTDVYENNSIEPCGRIRDICFSDGDTSVDAVLVESLSLIPICKRIMTDELGELYEGRLYLKRDMSKAECKTVNSKNVVTTQNARAKTPNGNIGKISDVRFDLETGEIMDIIIDNGFLKKKERFSVNKMYIKDNTIYIE